MQNGVFYSDCQKKLKLTHEKISVLGSAYFRVKEKMPLQKIHTEIARKFTVLRTDRACLSPIQNHERVLVGKLTVTVSVCR